MMRSVPGCAVLYPCDGVSTERLVVEMAQRQGMAYMRTSRPKTPVIYGPDETFPIGGSKVLRQSDDDDAVVIGAGVTVFEALKAYDQLQGRGDQHPRHRRVFGAADRRRDDARRPAKATGGDVITVEDHYAAGGHRRCGQRGGRRRRVRGPSARGPRRFRAAVSRTN